MHVAIPIATPHPLARQAWERYVDDPEVVDISQDDRQYFALLSRLWLGGDDFAIIEQDIEVHSSVMSEFDSCAQPWCAFAYNGPGYGQSGNPLLTTSLGCVRFRKELTGGTHDIFEGIAPIIWQRLDVWLGPILGKRGYSPCIHFPPVLHHHVYMDRCACGLDHESVPVDEHGRFAPDLGSVSA